MSELGGAVVAFGSQNPTMGDVALIFSDQSRIEVFVVSAIDPWVLRLPQGPIFVPDPGVPGWSRTSVAAPSPDS